MNQAGTKQERQLKLPLLRITGSGRVWVLNTLLVTAATALYWGVLRTLPMHSQLQPSTVHIPWWALAILFYLSEIYVVHFPFRQDSQSLSLSEIPLVLGLFFTSPEGLIAAQVIGAALALAYHRRQSLMKLVFNTGSLALGTTAATLIFHKIAALGNPLGPAGWIAVFAGTLGASVLAVLAIFVAISLSEGQLQLHDRPQAIAMALGITVTNTSLALIAVMILVHDTPAAWLLFVPTAMLFLTYRLYTSERQKHNSLESLYSATQVLQQSLKLEASMLSLLTQAREMFRAEIAEITLFSKDPAEPALQTTCGPEEDLDFMVPVQLDFTDGVWARVASEDVAVLIPRPIANPRLRQHFGDRGMRDAMIAPLHGEGGVIGTMTVGNRLGEVTTFNDEDLKLFETLANHASVSIQNARLVEQLQDSLVHLTEMNRLKDDFVAAVSHELRTPLTSIQGYVKTLLRPNVTWPADQQKDFIETIDRQADRLRNLIEDLLAVSRLEADRDAPELTTLSLQQMSQQITDDLPSRGPSHSMVIEFAEDFPEVKTDESMVHQIVSNLVDNALKYAPTDSTITITGRSEGRNVVISVRDEGGGIPEDAQDRIFDRFYQVDQSSTRAAGGTGLGLYICRKLADAIGGELWLESSDDQGSVFSLRIPVSSNNVSALPKATVKSPLYIVEGGASAAK
jgi:signal transduction histidine kinase